MKYLVVEKVEYENNIINTTWNWKLISSHVFYHLKGKWTIEENNKLQEKFLKFCKENNSHYEWVEDSFSRLEDEQERLENQLMDKLSNCNLECNEDKEKIVDSLYECTVLSDTYRDYFTRWCYSHKTELWEWFSCWCALMSAFLIQEGYELLSRGTKEEFWKLTK